MVEGIEPLNCNFLLIFLLFKIASYAIIKTLMDSQKASTGINGFGRFGQHFLKYWLENKENANFSIDYINDNFLTIQQVQDILKRDTYLASFYSPLISIEDNYLKFQTNSGETKILFTTSDDKAISWVGKPTILLECSGKNTNAENCKKFLKESTNLVLISATSQNAAQTLIYGFNHEALNAESQTISYGSCTVNAYVPLSNFINEFYGIIDSDVNVIHNIPEYTLKPDTTLLRKTCTLETSAPNLLPFINKDNFKVNYTNIPYTGTSIIDFRYRLKHVPSLESFLTNLDSVINNGKLKNLYEVIDEDNGPDAHKFTPYSAVLVKSGIKIVGDTLYIHAYFDNENSVTRYFDLANYIVRNKSNLK